MADKKQTKPAGPAKKKGKPAKSKAPSGGGRTSETSKERYNRILASLELKQVFVQEQSMKRDIDQNPKKTSVNIQRNNEAQIADDKRSFRVRDILHIEGLNEGSEDPLFAIDLTLLLQYQSEKAVTKTFLEQFLNTNLDIHSWPYFRELVQTATNKMNLPPLILPLNLK